MKSLAYCVSMVQLDRDDFSSRNYQRYLQYAINTYKEEIGVGISPSVNVMYGNLADNTLGVVDMPQDYEYYTKVAILVNGRYLTLTLNPDMPLNRRWDSCGDEINDADNNGTMNFPTIASAGYGYMFAGHFRAGNFVGELYGLGGGDRGVGPGCLISQPVGLVDDNRLYEVHILPKIVRRIQGDVTSPGEHSIGIDVASAGCIWLDDHLLVGVS